MARAFDKVWIEVRCNEYALRDHNPHVPWSPEEIAADASDCREAGAAILHDHAREPETGAPAWDAALYAGRVRRSTSPGCLPERLSSATAGRSASRDGYAPAFLSA